MFIEVFMDLGLRIEASKICFKIFSKPEKIKGVGEKKYITVKRDMLIIIEATCGEFVLCPFGRDKTVSSRILSSA